MHQNRRREREREREPSVTGVCVCVGPVSVQQRFEVLSEEDVTVDPQLKLASLSFWLNKKNFDSQQALLWCLSRTSSKPPPTNSCMRVCVLASLCVCVCSRLRRGASLLRGRPARCRGSALLQLPPASRQQSVWRLRQAFETSLPPPAGQTAQLHLQQEG